MCGLIGHLGKSKEVTQKRARTYIMDQFQDQIGRGTKGFGLITIGEDGHTEVLRATSEVKATLDVYMSRATHLLFHHRQPTSTENTMDQTHPMEVEHEELSWIWNVMHNGTIRNAELLKKEHEKLGYVYLTETESEYSAGYKYKKFNDSEALAIEIARFIEGKGINGEKPVIHCEGGFAFIAVATDKMMKVKAVYIASNGYGNLSLADNGKAWYFASEEKAGAKIPTDEIITFTAKYTPASTPGDSDDLVGFEKEDKPIKMEYYVEPTKALIPSPFSYRNRQTLPSTKLHEHRAGFRTHEHVPKPTGGGAAKKEDEDTVFSSYAHVVTYVRRSKLGDVFDPKWTNHEIIQEFPILEFDKAITDGKLDDAEDIYNKYKEGIIEHVDNDIMLGDTLDPQSLEELPENPTAKDMIEIALQICSKRMSEVAKDYLPLFRLCSYCECLIDMARQYELDKDKNSNPYPERATLIKNKIHMTPPEDFVNIDKDIEDEVNEVFPGNKNRLNWEGTDTEKDSTIVPTAKAYTSSRVDDLDTEAGAALTALGQEPEQRTADEIYIEAEEVGELIRNASQLAIMEQLTQATNAAAEEGLSLKIPFFFTKINDEITKTKRRLETLAQIVKVTKIKEDQDEYYAGGSPHSRENA